MKRITVSITIGDDSYVSPRELRGVKAAMVNAAVERATLNDMSIIGIVTKVATNVRKVQP
jgi:hypothetical protein